MSTSDRWGAVAAHDWRVKWLFSTLTYSRRYTVHFIQHISKCTHAYTCTYINMCNVCPFSLQTEYANSVESQLELKQEMLQALQNDLQVHVHVSCVILYPLR